MTWSTVVFIIQLFVAFAIGAFIVRISRDLVRELVVRSLPVEKRLSEESFNIQTRISTVIAFTLFFLVSGLSYWGLFEIKEGLWPRTTQVEQQTIFSLPDIPMVEEQEEILFEEEEKTILPSEESSTIESPTPLPNRYEEISKIEPSHQDHYSFQVGAYQNGRNALVEANKLLVRLQTRVQVVVIPNTVGPNKVLVGDFSTRKATVAYGKSHGLTGFVRKVR